MDPEPLSWSTLQPTLTPTPEPAPQPDYSLFDNWFHSNGGRVGKVTFPTRFPPTGYIGLAAAATIRANQVFLAVPKSLIISVSAARESSLGPIMKQYQCLSNEEDEQTDFNVIALFLIWHRMQGKDSFFYPYLQAIQQPETIISWPDADIRALHDPYITVQFVSQLRQQFPPLFSTFHALSLAHPALFPTPITWQQFLHCYSIVMTRCFGWGLPETMLVPYADFLNHDCHGVHHYVYSGELEAGQGQGQHQREYVRKRRQLDLGVLGVDNREQLPRSYAPTLREQYVNTHQHLLSKYDPTARLHHAQTRSQLALIHSQLLPHSYDTNLYPSSDSEDNDSEQYQSHEGQIKQKVYARQLRQLVQSEIEPKYQQPKPSVNREFEDEVGFGWWHGSGDKYFIVAAQKQYEKDEQIYNSYGRRSNRFLLIWYGFTHAGNKYDSVGFRFWDEQVYESTGKLLFAKFLTEKDWREYLCLGNERYSFDNVTDEYRLKRDSLCYQLMAYLRLRATRRNQTWRKQLSKKQISIHRICNLELQSKMLELYSLVLTHLSNIYQVGEQQCQLSRPHRTHFAQVLRHSTREILRVHGVGVRVLRAVLRRVGDGDPLLAVYRAVFEEQGVAEGEQCRSRKFCLDYFKMLGKFLGKDKQ